MTTPALSPHAGDSDFSSERLTVLRNLLLCELVEQMEQRARSRARVTELTGQTDPDSAFLRELAASAAAYADDAVRDARAALLRLGDGTYGRCERCDGHIPVERLEAVPHARLCVACVAVSSGRLR